jgi:glycosyltransferase involved in cell wall biosynthesis
MKQSYWPTASAKQTSCRFGQRGNKIGAQPKSDIRHARISITIPVYNEESCLANSLKRIHDFLSETKFGWDWEIVIADNGSTDRTRQIAETFQGACPRRTLHSALHTPHSRGSALRIPRSAIVAGSVRLVTLAQKGRGRALKHIWLNSDADVLVYMDADLSTELDALPALVGALIRSSSSFSSIPDSVSDMEAASETDGSERGRERLNAYDLAVGSRLLRPDLTTRSRKREIISRCYNRLIKLLFPKITFPTPNAALKLSLDLPPGVAAPRSGQ